MAVIAHASNNSSRYLEHYGILGQRWGVIRTPQQLGHAPEGGKDYEIMKGKDPNADDKKARGTLGKVVAKVKAAKQAHDTKVKKAKAVQKRKETIERKKAEKEAHEQEVKELSKSPAKALKNLDKLSNDEIRSAIERYNLQSQLERLNDQRVTEAAKKGSRAVDSILNAGNKVAQGINTASNIYDSFAKIYNAYATHNRTALLPRLNNENNTWAQRRTERIDARREAREDFINARNDREHDEDRARQRRAEERRTREDPSGNGDDDEEDRRRRSGSGRGGSSTGNS